MIYTPLGYEQITSLSAGASLTVPERATRARISCEAQAVRWRDDGTSPTPSVGMHLAVDTDLWYVGDLGVVEFIEETASAKLNVSYYR